LKSLVVVVIYVISYRSNQRASVIKRACEKISVK